MSGYEFKCHGSAYHVAVIVEINGFDKERDYVGKYLSILVVWIFETKLVDSYH